MNAQITVHPRLHHLGLTTGNLDAMVDWYRKVLGMTINRRLAVPAEAQNRPPFSAFAFVSNDEMDHRIVFFEVPGVAADPERRRHTGLQHIDFECATFDDLLGTYVRLKGEGILPGWAVDHGVGTSFYYADPDQNIVEINVNNYGNAWTATEHLRTSPPTHVQVDPDKLIAARKAGASGWELHERAVADEFAPAKPYELHARF